MAKPKKWRSEAVTRTGNHSELAAALREGLEVDGEEPLFQKGHSLRLNSGEESGWVSNCSHRLNPIKRTILIKSRCKTPMEFDHENRSRPTQAAD